MRAQYDSQLEVASPGLVRGDAISSPGVRRDMAHQTDLERDIPFFSSLVQVERFIALLTAHVSSLPECLAYTDLGGGQGLLALELSQSLEKRGHQISTTVLDANPAYLERAAERGLRVLRGNIEALRLTEIDLATMRLVNHYNPLPAQLALLHAARRALSDGGWFVSEIETGEAALCELLTAVASCPELVSDGTDGCCWVAADDYVGLLRQVGFRNVKLAGYSLTAEEPLCDVLGEAWKRYHGGRLPSPKEQPSSQYKAFVDSATQLVVATYRSNGPRCGVTYLNEEFFIKRQHAVVIARK